MTTHFTDQMADNAARALSPENAAILRRVAASEPFDCRREGVSQTRLKGLRNKTLVRAEPLELVWYVTEFGRAVLAETDRTRDRA